MRPQLSKEGWLQQDELVSCFHGTKVVRLLAEPLFFALACTNCPAMNFGNPYIMCYLCRQDIREEKYTHFCQHPREPGAPCTECTRCDLFKAPDDEILTREAGQRAVAEYLRTHPEVARENYRKTVDFLFT